MGVADYAPYTFRRTTFMDIGGLDEGASEPGQCGIISDWEVSTRVWLAGWQVGYMHVPVSQDSAQGGWRQLLYGVVLLLCSVVQCHAVDYVSAMWQCYSAPCMSFSLTSAGTPAP